MRNKTLTIISALFLFSLFTFPNFTFSQQKGNVLASKSSYNLTEGNVQIYVKIMQFVIGQKIKKSEVAEIRRESITEFNQDPQKYMNELSQWEGILKQIQKTTNPIQIADGRMLFVREFYKFTEATPKNELPAAIKIFNRYIKVLNYNSQTQLVLTNRDIEAVLNYIDFSRKLGGFSALSYAEKQNFRQVLPNYYVQLQPQQQAVFAIMPIVWEVIDGQWQRLTPKQKRRAIAQFKAQNIQNVPQYQNTTPTGTYQNQQQMQQQQQMYQTLSNMSRSSHLTTMNILENIGDGGGYWTMTDNF